MFFLVHEFLDLGLQSLLIIFINLLFNLICIACFASLAFVFASSGVLRHWHLEHWWAIIRSWIIEIIIVGYRYLIWYSTVWSIFIYEGVLIVWWNIWKHRIFLVICFVLIEETNSSLSLFSQLFFKINVVHKLIIAWLIISISIYFTSS